MTSRILLIPVRYMISRSKPSPKPACLTPPYLRKSRYHHSSCIFIFNSCMRRARSFALFLWLPPINSHPRYQKVHGGYGFTVIILAHVKGLDIFGVIGHKHRFLNIFR